MLSNHDNLFQTTADLARADQRRVKHAAWAKIGSPINLSSKPLTLLVNGDDAWVAEACAVVRKISLKTKKTLLTLKDHTGPVTSIVLHQDTVISGSWDKSIRVFSAKDGKLLCTKANAHTDFVKCLLVIPELQVLVSGGSDNDIRIWSHSSTSLTFLHSIRGTHTRPIECLLYHFTSKGEMLLFTADTMGRCCIFELRKEGDRIKSEQLLTWLAAETAIYDFHIVKPDEDDEPSSQITLWMASADNSLYAYLYDTESASTTPKQISKLTHPYFVKSLLHLPSSLTGNAQDLVITGSTDESIRVWSIEDSTCLNLVQGHSHEVNTLESWWNEGELWIVSSGLDCTIRRWRFTDMLEKQALPELKVPEPETEKLEMTADEAKELEELMSD